MNDVKAEFKSCLTTGVVGFLLAVSVISGAYHLCKQSEKEKTAEPKKILSNNPKQVEQKINYREK